MSVSGLQTATARLAGPVFCRAGAALGLFFAAATLAACSPYPDDGEFLAGVVYSANFLAGVKNIAQNPAVGRGQNMVGGVYPYTLIETTSSSSGGITVSTSAPAVAPFWTNGGKRNPLDRGSTQQVYVFDGSCAAPPNYDFDDRIDLIRMDRQYPLFADIPEVLSTNSGKAGRLANYSAVVEVIHLSAPGNLPCQSIKRFDTAQGRVGDGGDLTEGLHEYRLLQIIDPAIAVLPLPVRLGFYNQLVVPYIDMGPVPLEPDGKTFRTMPLYKVLTPSNTAAGTVTFGRPDDAGPIYSPICRDYTLKLMTGMMMPLDATDPLFAGAAKTDTLSSCLICRTLDDMGNLDCPFTATEMGLP